MSEYTAKLYRKKPVEVYAVRYDPILASDYEVNDLAVFLDGCTGWRSESDEKGPYLVIPTLEGDHRADPGDFIIKGVAGEFYPCKPGIFKATYDQV